MPLARRSSSALAIATNAAASGGGSMLVPASDGGGGRFAQVARTETKTSPAVAGQRACSSASAPDHMPAVTKAVPGHPSRCDAKTNGC